MTWLWLCLYLDFEEKAAKAAKGARTEVVFEEVFWFFCSKPRIVPHIMMFQTMLICDASHFASIDTGIKGTGVSLISYLVCKRKNALKCSKLGQETTIEAMQKH